MVLFYIESSALVKRYVEEKGTEVVDFLFKGRQDSEFLGLLSLSILEMKSALRRLVKGRFIKERQVSELLADLRRNLAQVSFVVKLDETLLEEAISIVDRHTLRAGDALHLAAILQFKYMVQSMGDLIVVSSDNEHNKNIVDKNYAASCLNRIGQAQVEFAKRYLGFDPRPPI